MINGFLNVNKPSGISSNFVLTKLKKMLPQKTKVGHLGTLDSLTTGVLPVAVGKATKLFDLMLLKTKTYEATFQFGYETDTLDSEGKIVDKSNNIPTQFQIENVLKTFIGKQQQIPPKYSAKNINGNRAYELARQNIDFELNSKEIEIFNFLLLQQIDNSTFKFKIECSSGTYIRSIARDLAKKLNTYATMTALIRTQSGPFNLQNSIKIEDINIFDNIIKIDNVLKLEKITVNNDNEVLALKNGMNVKINLNNCENLFVYACQELLGIGKIEQGYLKLKLHLY